MYLLDALPSRFAISLLIACALHIVVLFGFILPAKAPAQNPDKTLRVTLATQPDTETTHNNTIAFAGQRGTDTHSVKAALPGRPSPSNPTRSPQSAAAAPNTVAILARPAERARANNQPSSAEQTTSGQQQVQTARAHAAVADERAAYLSAWRRVVEHTGNQKLPDSLLQQDAGKRLTLEVTLKADGSIVNMRVRKSSGDPALDAAAQQVLREAAPFAAFPEAIRSRYPTLRFAYDWRFLPGTGESGHKATDSP